MKKFSKKLSFFVLFTLTILISLSLNANANDGRYLYVVETRESVKMIAEKTGIDAELLAAMNELSPQTILSPGKKIWLPQDPEDTIIVKKGDTLWDLAKEYNTTVAVLVTNNNISNANSIHIGQALKIPVSDSVDDTVLNVILAEQNQAITTASRGSTFIWPLKGIITSKYGPRGSGFHHGLDIAADIGTPIAAIKSGKVIRACWHSDIYGYVVTIDHGNGEESLYAHLNKILVDVGDVVYKGQIIAQVGETGNATGPHLHLQISIDNKTVDPLIYLR